MERTVPHTLTAEIDFSDHTRTLLWFASDLHRRDIALTALSFTIRTSARVRIDAQFTATERQARTAQHTVAGRVDMLSTELTARDRSADFVQDRA